MWKCSKKKCVCGGQVGLSLRVWESVSSEKLFRLQTPRDPIWITNVFRFFNRSQVLVSWGILGPIKACDNDFHPRGHHRGLPPYWPLHCRQVIAPTVLLPGSTKHPKTALGSMSLFLSVALFLLAALFWFKSGLIKDNPLLSCGQIILTPI